MSWKTAINGYKNYLLLERSLSKNTIDGYIRDVNKFCDFFSNKIPSKIYNSINSDDFQDFLIFLHDKKISARSQSRAISSIKSFYKYLVLEKLISSNPSELIESPKIVTKLPDVLSIEEIKLLIKNSELNKNHGIRNSAILETLYGSGLRVSELINLKLSDIHYDDKLLLIQGKGNKQRLVPLGSISESKVSNYVNNYRILKKVKKNSNDIVFLNRNGKKLTHLEVLFLFWF